MTKTPTRNLKATARQLKELHAAGCDIVRLAVPDEASAKALGTLKKKCRMPMVADIHFDYRLAVQSIEAGAHAVRINPTVKRVFTKYSDAIRYGV